MSWASLLKASAKAAKWVGKGAKESLEATGKAAIHPQTTLKGAGNALKTATVGAGLGYVGWQKITTDQSVVGIVSDALIGSENTKAVQETIQGAADGIRDLKESVGNMTDKVSDTMGTMDSNLNGVTNFLGEMTSGNGGKMISNFFTNLTHGNVSGLSVIGLVASAFMLFGRFGWMGKLAGAVLGMMMIGNNFKMEKSQNDVLSQNKNFEPQQIKVQEQEPEQIHRTRR